VLILIHGGRFDHRCWNLVLPHLRSAALAVDLPGRGRKLTTDLNKVTASECARSVANDLVGADLHDVVLVGHSLAGITLPKVMRLVPQRIRRVVFVSCAVPAQGQSVLDAMEPATRELSRKLHRNLSQNGTLDPDRLDREIALARLCNDMNEEQIAFTLGCMVRESARLSEEPADVSPLHESKVPMTWVRLLKDRILFPQMQDEMIARLRPVEVIDQDAGHMAMISQPAELAKILNGIDARSELKDHDSTML